MADLANADDQRLAAVADALGHRFRDPGLLFLGLTHASRLGAQASATDRRDRSNERLEFLGDSMLGAAICLLLYRRFADQPEGTLARWKANLASRTVLARRLDDTELTIHGRVGSQMGNDPEAWPDSVKANLVEGILGAIFLDGGWDPLVVAVEHLIGPLLEDPANAAVDARQRLQEWSLARHQRLPSYAHTRTGGTDHLPEFTATVSIAEHTASGTATSRRRAEAAAAAALMRSVGA